MSSAASSSTRHQELPASAYDRYISDLTGNRASAYTSASSGYGDIFGTSRYASAAGNMSAAGHRGSAAAAASKPRTYVFEPDFEPLSSKYSSRINSSYGAARSSSDSYHSNSTNSRSSEYVPRSSLSARMFQTGISSAPAYDKFGKELSNYERWKLSSTGGSYDIGDTITSNNDYLSRIHVSGGESEAAALRAARKQTRLNNNLESSSSVIISSSQSRDERGRTVAPSSFREYSVAPSIATSQLGAAAGSDSSCSPAITGSRFSGRAATAAHPSSRSSVEPAFLPSISSSSSTAAAVTVVGHSHKPPSSHYNDKYVTSFPSDVKAKLVGYNVRDVRGDGGCYYRCLSVYFTGGEDSYNRYRKEVMSYIKQNEDNYKSMIRSEVGYASINDYFVRKTRSDRQEFAETTEIIATSCLYNINVHVLALVPGSRRSWEWLHFDPSIGTGRPSNATRDIYLYNQGSVHFMLCTPK